MKSILIAFFMLLWLTACEKENTCEYPIVADLHKTEVVDSTGHVEFSEITDESWTIYVFPDSVQVFKNDNEYVVTGQLHLNSLYVPWVDGIPLLMGHIMFHQEMLLEVTPTEVNVFKNVVGYDTYFYFDRRNE